MLPLHVLNAPMTKPLNVIWLFPHSLVELDSSTLMEFVPLVQLISPPVLQPPTELLAEEDSSYLLHGPTVLLVQLELLPVPLLPLSKNVTTDTTLPQLLDSMLPVPLVQAQEMLLPVITLLMPLLVNQDSTPSTDLVLLVHLTLTLVTEELSLLVMLDSS